MSPTEINVLPFDLPFLKIKTYAKLSRPAAFKSKQARGTAGTAFHGALKAILYAKYNHINNLRAWLLNPASKTVECGEEGGGIPLGPKPIYVKTSALDGHAFENAIPLEIMFVGRLACGAAQTFFEEPVKFKISPEGFDIDAVIDPIAELPVPSDIKTYANAITPKNGLAEEAIVEFATALAIEISNRGAMDNHFNPDRVIADFVRQLVLFDMADRGLSKGATNKALQEMVLSFQTQTAERMKKIDASDVLAMAVEYGQRFQGVENKIDEAKKTLNPNVIRRDRGTFKLSGLIGYWKWKGDLTEMIPILAAMEILGLGGRRTYGCGEVKLWIK